MFLDRYCFEFYVSSLSVIRYYFVKFGKNVEMRKIFVSDELMVCCSF